VTANSHSGECPLVVRRPVMIHRWEHLTFMHWSFDPDVVQALLPDGLTVDTYDGRAWVGLVPFMMWVAPPGVPALPWLGRFCETNVRTYAKDEHGRDGVWFLSLEAARGPAVIAARVGYQLPYFWADMDLDRQPTHTSYRSRRRIPGPKGARANAEVEIGQPYERSELTPFDHFLTARFRLFSASRTGKLRYADAEHDLWPLRRANIEMVDETLIAAAGLPQPSGPPIAHYSNGVEVRIGRPRRVGFRPLR
jgi:uncharacterized protein